jgi:uncharacterized protein YqeY
MDSEQGDLRQRLRQAIPPALKARDRATVAALRSALAAIENAEAVDAAAAPPPLPGGAGTAGFAGAVVGLRAGEVARRSLTEAEVERIVRAEVAERDAAARDYAQAGQLDHAARLRAEASALAAYVVGPAESPAEPGE